MDSKIIKNGTEYTESTESDKKKPPIFSILDGEQFSNENALHSESNSEGEGEEEQKIQISQRNLYKINDIPVEDDSIPVRQQQPTPSKKQEEPVEQPTPALNNPKDHANINPEQELFSHNKELYLYFMKAVFIIQEILDPIEADNLLNYKQESHLQFMFLVWVRVRNYLEAAAKLMKDIKINPNSKSQLTNIDAYLQKSKAKFNIYNTMLDQIRSKFGQKIRSIFHMKKSVTGKQRFLDGFQEFDYTPPEQIQFTYCNYVEIVLNSSEIKSPYFKNHRFKKVLKAYRKICELTSWNLENEYQVKVKFNDIVTDQ